MNTLKTAPVDSKRDYQMDNIRFLMIFFVVFGHLLETINGNVVTASIYRLIYSFHIPVLLFISGYFSRFKPMVLVRKILLPYFIFQVFYLAFDCFILNDQKSLTLQFTKPYWLLWYLLSLFFYNMMLPLFQTDDKDIALIKVIICVILSLAAGFDNTIGYYMSLSRTLVFLPFFVAGYYCAAFSLRTTIYPYKRIAAVCAGAMILVFEYLIIRFQIPATVFYGLASYSFLESNGLIRLLFLICAFCWIVLFVSAIPSQKIPFITSIGQQTLPIFLLHGFVQRIILKLGLLQGDPFTSLLCVGVITVFLVTTLSIRPINSLFRKLF